MSAPRYSPTLHRLFARYLRGYFRRHFNAVRADAQGLAGLSTDQPIIVCSNHPAWWDPILLLLIGDRYFAGRRCYGPIDAEAVQRYPILERLGLFGVDRASHAGLRTFLRACDDLLARPDTALGITAEGEFRDARQRPAELAPGLAHLVRRHPHVPVIPLAIEYPFWFERSPEALVRIGAPVQFANTDSVTDIQQALTAAMEANQDALAELSMARDEEAFATLVDGKRGVGGIYDLGRRLRAALRGERFDAGHVRNAEIPGGSR